MTSLNYLCDFHLRTRPKSLEPGMKNVPVEIVMELGVHLLGIHQPNRFQLVRFHPVHTAHIEREIKFIKNV